MALRKEVIQCLEKHAVNEVDIILALEGAGLKDENTVGEGSTTRTMLGWLAFLMEIRIASFLDKGAQITKIVDLEKEMNVLREESPHDEKFAARWNLEEVIYGARLKALAVSTGEIEPQRVFRLKSMTGFPPYGDTYMPVDWVREWRANPEEIPEHIIEMWEHTH